MTIERHLDALESQLLRHSPAYVATCSGNLQVRLMRSAYSLLCLAHPILTAHLAETRSGYLFRIGNEARPHFVWREGDIDTINEEVLRPSQPQRELAKLITVTSADTGFVALKMDHSIADGSAKMEIFQQLWKIYSALHRGEELRTSAKHTLPDAPLKTLASRWSPRGGSTELAPDLTSPSTQVQHQKVPLLTSRTRLNCEQTKRLIEVARRESCSVHGIICGAILVALRSRGHATPKGHEEMACLAPIDLRRRVNPPVGPTDTTVFGTQHRSIVKVAPDSDPVVIAKDVKKQLDEAIGGQCLPEASSVTDLLQKPVRGHLEERLSKTSISNYGTLKEFCVPDDVTITDFYTPLVETTSEEFPVYSVYTYKGELSISHRYPSSLFDKSEVAEIDNTIQTTITTL